MIQQKKESFEEQKVIHELADKIHQTMELQGSFCNHPGPGLYSCLGLARVVINFFKERR